jgi:hypothetical protein
VRITQAVTHEVSPCPVCTQTHSYDFQAIIEEKVGVIGLAVPHTEAYECVVVCPEKGSSFAVDVPIWLESAQRLVSVQ